MCVNVQQGDIANLRQDCEGVCDGPAELDDCGVCNGDGTACLDCSSNCFNVARCFFPSLFDSRGEQLFTFSEQTAKGKSCRNC